VELHVFGALYAADGTPPDTLEAVAREFSPRIEVHGAREITLDLSGLERLFGEARTIAEEIRRTAADRGLRVRVVMALTRSAARLLVRYRAGIAVIAPGTEAVVLAPLPLSLLECVAVPTAGSRSAASAPPRVIGETLRRWGLRTVGDLAMLSADEIAARLGQDGVAWQRMARGEDARPLVPALPEERFEQALDLEWPIDGLEPLSFVLARLLEPLEAHLARRDRGAAILHVRLHLVTRTVYERALQLPAPMRDARALRTLALLDLESHPPESAIDRVVVAVDPTPGRVVQFSLLTRALPSPERLSTLMARLSALMGEGRCGSPAAVDTWQPGAFAVTPFAPREANGMHDATRRRGDAESNVRTNTDPLRHRGTEPWSIRDPAAAFPSSVSELSDRSVSVPRSVVEAHVAPVYLFAALRRFRTPLPARVRTDEGRPVRVTIDRRGFAGGRVETAAGPWRTSGAWWRADAWEHDEWDVSVSDGTTYRLHRERDADGWFVDGIVD
jgi:protein ImuB